MERVCAALDSERKSLLRVLAGEALSPPPVWLMRQAGRYLPEYRAVREKAGSFLDLCYTPELAAEVTLQPIRRFGFDAAILFADILLVPQALGLELRFAEGEGPRLAWTGGRVDPAALAGPDAVEERLAPVYETVALLREQLPADTALIGFAGAPWTVATYMIAGRGTPDQGPARRMMFEDTAGFEALIERVTAATIRYLSRQVAAGAEVVMLFDSWAGVLTPPAFERWAVRPVRRIVEALAAAHPGVPVIGFPRGAGAMYEGFAVATGVAGVGLDAQVPLGWARRALTGAAAAGQSRPDADGRRRPGDGGRGSADRRRDAGVPACLQPRPRYHAGCESCTCRGADPGGARVIEATQDFLAGWYLWLKAFHVISVVAWMAGMFYLPRLFVYHAERARPGSELSETLKEMERKLLRVIMNPAMIAVWTFGLLMLGADIIDWSRGWPWVKAVFVLAMTWFHHSLALWRKDFAADRNMRPGRFYRIANEVPTLMLIVIVVMAVAEPF